MKFKVWELTAIHPVTGERLRRRYDHWIQARIRAWALRRFPYPIGGYVRVSVDRIDGRGSGCACSHRHRRRRRAAVNRPPGGPETGAGRS
jgi:hypothetical protein